MDWNNGMGWHNGMGWGSTGILMILLWGLVIWGIITLVRHVNVPDQPRDHEATTSSDEILATRFARGEIDAEEYNTRLALLRSPQRAGASTHDTQPHRNDRTVT